MITYIAISIVTFIYYFIRFRLYKSKIKVAEDFKMSAFKKFPNQQDKFNLFIGESKVYNMLLFMALLFGVLFPVVFVGTIMNFFKNDNENK